MDNVEPRSTLAELVERIEGQLGSRLLGLYLFGSLAAGGFHPGRSDLDLLAVLDTEIETCAELDALRAMHSRFEAERPPWRDRIEVLYLSRGVLQTFAKTPRGRVTRISPGEPLHQRDLADKLGWRLDWHGVLTAGETLLGPPPLELGPEVPPDAFRAAVVSELRDWPKLARHSEVAYLPAHQGYIVATVCRALHAIATGQQTSKEAAVAWYATENPYQAEFVWGAYDAYRADIHGRHERLIRFVDGAAVSVEAGRRRR